MSLAKKVIADFTAEAAKDLSSFQHRFCKVNTGGNITNTATGGDIPAGVIGNKTADATGKSVVVETFGVLLVTAGTTSGNAGDLLQLGTTGKVSKHTQGTGTRAQVVGIALEDYTTGVTFKAQIPAPFHRGEV